MKVRPGGDCAARPFHIDFLCDTSGSMGCDGKIEALNRAMKMARDCLCKGAVWNPFADIQLRVIRFSHGAEWHVAKPTRPADLVWTDLIADPLQKPAVDIVFMVDTSGSMCDAIDAVKAHCVAFADHVSRAGANVRLGLVGFDIGGHRRWDFGVDSTPASYAVHDLSAYTIGVWPLTSPAEFKKQAQSLELGLFGGGGCYVANADTVDMFPHVVAAYDGPQENKRVLVIISDEMGDSTGLDAIVAQLRAASITAHVLGVPSGCGLLSFLDSVPGLSSGMGAHQLLAKRTGGRFWDIASSKGALDFGSLLDTVGQTIAKETTQTLLLWAGMSSCSRRRTSAVSDRAHPAIRSCRAAPRRPAY